MSPSRVTGWRAGYLFGMGPALLLFILLAADCSEHGKEPDEVHRLTRPMMGTLVEVLWRERGTVDTAVHVREVLDRMRVLSEAVSPRNSDSEIARINAAAGRSPVKVSKQVIDIIEMSLAASRLTDGAFDVTVGSVEQVWGDIQWGGGGDLPDEVELEEALSMVGYQGVRVNRQKDTVVLEKEGTRLDFGGIAKGYVIDRGMEWLQERGLRSFMINAGGDIRATSSPGDPWWRVGLQDPFMRDNLLGVFQIRQGAVVTSGNYERYAETTQGRASHILDPHTGRPTRGLASVTVLAPEAAASDALATALMVKGREQGIELLQRLGTVSAVLVEDDSTIWVARELKGILKLNQAAGTKKVRYFGPIPSSS